MAYLLRKIKIRNERRIIMGKSYRKKYKLNPALTNKYCESVMNPTVQPDEKTMYGVPVPTIENVNYSKEYGEENQL